MLQEEHTNSDSIGLPDKKVAQLVAHMARNHDVAGSNPAFIKIGFVNDV